MTANGIAHFDVFGPEPEALHAFYAGVFGWEIDVRGPGYALVRTPEGAPDGAVVESDRARADRSASWCPTSTPRWRPPRRRAARS